MMKKKIKVNFVDFWNDFDKRDNYFFHLLSTKYDVEIDEIKPDFLFFSVDYNKRKDREKYSDRECKKIFFAGENVSPNFHFPFSIEYPKYSIGKAHFAFSNENNGDPRNYRFPLWAMSVIWFNVPYRDDRDISFLAPLDGLLKREPSKYKQKSKFCNFIYSNNSGYRLKILEAVQKYKHVDSVGRLANNVGYTIQGRGDQLPKINFISDYKFAITPEHTKNAGFTTEKILQTLYVGSVPIYWGSEIVNQDFNKDSFINVDDFSSLEEMVEYIKEVDNNKELYEKYLSVPAFPDGKIPEHVKPENVLKFFEENILC